MKQQAVRFIVWAWPLMPRRVRLWAMLSDNDDWYAG